MVKKDAYLILENGKVFKGKFLGAQKEATFELVFNTAMGGYSETLTDARYFGQAVVQTFPLIGNYGIIPEEFQAEKFFLSAYIVKEACEYPSNFRSQGTIDALLKKAGIPGICEIDTRTLTKILRKEGVMNAKLTADPKDADLEEIKNYKIKDAVKAVSVKKSVVINEKGGKSFVLFDFGFSGNIIKELTAADRRVSVVPFDGKLSDIKGPAPSGIILSDGPGDPLDIGLDNIKEIIRTNIPVFAIGLGHQLLARAFGFKTFKLKHGHRGASQPVKDCESGRVLITNQNHGYAVLNESVDKNIAQINLINVNDKTCEGLKYTAKPFVSTQFFSEALFRASALLPNEK